MKSRTLDNFTTSDPAGFLQTGMTDCHTTIERIAQLLDLRASDAEYMAAVERGDMEAAKRMVDEAAKAAGFGIKAYHSTDNEFTSFDPRRLGEFTARNSPPEQGMSLAKLGFWFHERPLSQVIGQKHDLAVYLKLDEPLETTFDELWDNPVIENDSAIVQDTEFGGVSYIVKDPSNIKSADPVTYDDRGRVIPLSERFNDASPDIRC